MARERTVKLPPCKRGGKLTVHQIRRAVTRKRRKPWISYQTLTSNSGNICPFFQWQQVKRLFTLKAIRMRTMTCLRSLDILNNV